MSMKNSGDTIGNQSRVLPVCSVVPQAGQKINTVNKNTELLLVTSQKFDLEVSGEKTKYMFTLFGHDEG
jgi:hypothetical protein